MERKDHHHAHTLPYISFGCMYPSFGPTIGRIAPAEWNEEEYYATGGIYISIEEPAGEGWI